MKKLDRGFTIIEIIVVVFLISLIMGISTIYFANSLPTAKFKSAVKEFAASIKYAKHLASKKNEAQIINIDLDGKTYSLNKGEIRKMPKELIITIRETFADIKPVSSGQYNIVYNSTGGSNWENINFRSGNKSITISSDPVMVAKIKEEDK